MIEQPLRADERLDEVNDRLRLIQRRDGLTFGTDALLLAAYITGHAKRAAEWGTGTGILSLLLLTRERVDTVEAVELQPAFAELARRNAALNGLQARMQVTEGDVREQPSRHDLELVFTNPPYLRAGCGRSNDSTARAIARHELHGDILDFCQAAARRLRFGGKFYVVYRPDRLPDLMAALQASGLAPKRMTLVHADAAAPPSSVLLEARRGGGGGLRVTPPLLLHPDATHAVYSEAMQHILSTGSFTAPYLLQNRGRCPTTIPETSKEEHA